MSRIRVGTRGSALALWQANHVRQRLAALGHEVELQVIVTTGDRVLDRRLENVGGKGAFLKEIEEAMLAREVDLAVHSLKDVPTALPAGLTLCAMLERADPRDALLSSGARLADLPSGAVVGTTSLRRQALARGAAPRPRRRAAARERRHAHPTAARGVLRRDPARDGGPHAARAARGR